MAIDNLRFTNREFNYLLYRTYHADDQSFYAGIKITDPTGKVTRIIARNSTIKGCICNLEETSKIEKQDIGLEF